MNRVLPFIRMRAQTMVRRIREAPNSVAAICALLVTISFVGGVFFLDRRPAFVTDEGFHNIPAARYVRGLPFRFVFNTEAPHTDKVTSGHGPFFSHLQIGTFGLFGVSHLTSRLPSYIAAHMALLILCLVLVGEGYPLSALVAAIAWMGDPSMLETGWGRPDGLSHLFLVLAFATAVRAVGRTDAEREPPAWGWMAALGCCLGMATGFHPGAVYPGLVVMVAVFLLLPPRGWLGACAAAGLGALAPALLLLLCWSPYVRESYEQLLWNIHYNLRLYPPGQTKLLDAAAFRLWARWPWSHYWHLLLMLVTVLILAPFGLATLVRWWRRAWRVDARRVRVPYLAAALAVGTLCLVKQSSKYGYYWLYFTSWPVVALAAFWESGVWETRVRPWFVAAALLLLVTWLPGPQFNVMRRRESLLWYDILDHRPLVEFLRRSIPPHAPVMGSPALFVEMDQAGINYTSLSWFRGDKGYAKFLRDEAWLVAFPVNVDVLNTLDPAWSSRRPAPLVTNFFAGGEDTMEQCLLYPPATNKPPAGTRQEAPRGRP